MTSRRNAAVTVAKTVVKRSLLGLLCTQLTVAATLTGVHHWRKRHRPKHVRFPQTEPAEFPVGESKVAVFTYGEHLYADMLQAIRSALHTIYFESFIWKGDDVGHQFKQALIEAAERGVQVYVIYDGFANLVVPPSFKRFPSSLHVMEFPVVNTGMLFSIRR